MKSKEKKKYVVMENQRGFVWIERLTEEQIELLIRFGKKYMNHYDSKEKAHKRIKDDLKEKTYMIKLTKEHLK